MATIQLIGLNGFPLVQPGDDLVALIRATLVQMDERVQPGDVVVVAQKVVSKSEGRLVNLNAVQPNARALRIARAISRDPRHVQSVLDESREVLWATPGIFVVEQRNGYVCANAGVDRSNIEQKGAGEWLALLPGDCDALAARLRAALLPEAGGDIAVIINDTHGRAFREGGVGVALGAAGIEALLDQRGDQDLFGYTLHNTFVAVADELASAASCLMGQAAEATPVVIVRGYHYRRPATDRGARPLVRPRERDVFRYPARHPSESPYANGERP